MNRAMQACTVLSGWLSRDHQSKSSAWHRPQSPELAVLNTLPLAGLGPKIIKKCKNEQRKDHGRCSVGFLPIKRRSPAETSDGQRLCSSVHFLILPRVFQPATSRVSCWLGGYAPVRGGPGTDPAEAATSRSTNSPSLVSRISR